MYSGNTLNSVPLYSLFDGISLIESGFYNRLLQNTGPILPREVDIVEKHDKVTVSFKEEIDLRILSRYFASDGCFAVRLPENISQPNELYVFLKPPKYNINKPDLIVSRFSAEALKFKNTYRKIFDSIEKYLHGGRIPSGPDGI